MSKGWFAWAAIAHSIFIIHQAIWLRLWTIAGWPRPSLFAAAVGIAFGIADHTKRTWARWLGAVWLALLVFVHVVNNCILGWDLRRSATLAAVCAGCIIFYVLYFRMLRKQLAEDGDEKPVVRSPG